MEKIIYFFLFICTNSFGQSYNSIVFFEPNDGQFSLTKNVKLENDNLLISIYLVHGFMDLTELHHYVVDSKKNVIKFIEKQSKDEKLVAFEFVEFTKEEQKQFLKNLNSLFKSKFLKFHPKEFYYENPNKRFRCGGNSDMPTKGIVISNLKSMSNYKSYDGYHKLQFCDLIHKENLKEFLKIYNLFEFTPHNSILK